ncbi:MAG: response regulator [Phormidesmis sp.]
MEKDSVALAGQLKVTRRLLVIDDEEAIRIILKAVLAVTANWQVLTAASGHTGLEIAQAEQPDAILLDVNMPDLDGISLFHKLQSLPLTQDIPAIFLTAQAREAERKALEALGAGVILKPFEPVAIAQQIRTILNWPHREI